VVLA
jgi:hypothetical protein